MSVLFLLAGDGEADAIDAYRPGMNNTQPKTTQQDNPDEDRQSGLVPAEGYTLPDPTVGGVFGSRIRNGFSTGMVSRIRRNAPFSGAMAKLPANVANPVQGAVGRNQKHAASLSAGVRDQQTNYTGSLRSFAKTYLGNITPVGSLPAADPKAETGT